MPRSYKVCKVCGKVYLCCKSSIPNGIFRWQDVACCPEHGMEYFKQIEESRKAESEEVIPSEEVTPTETDSLPEEDIEWADSDEEEEEDFFDEEEDEEDEF